MRQINRTSLILVLIIILGGFLRFYKLDWGNGLFTHPDEYHLVISASQLSFPDQLNPNFFSYGTVTIYLMYFTKLLLSTVNHELITMNYFLIGRFFSALFSTLTIFLIYKISRKFIPVGYALIAAALAALTPGLIQQAHFATPESNLIFFLLASLFFSLNFLQLSKLRYLILASISLGIALGVKVSGAFFLSVPLLLITVKFWPHIPKIMFYGLVTIGTTLIALFIVDPYIFLDFPRFYSTFNYESSLAAGEIPVFYTRQFINTTSILFQLEKIYPYVLGLPLLVFGTLGFFLMLISIYEAPRSNDRGIFSLLLRRERNPSEAEITSHSSASLRSRFSAKGDKDQQNRLLCLILATGYLSLFLPNAFLFAKWTRFISPTFPFFAIFAAFFLYKLSELKIHKSLPLILNTFYLLLVSLWLLAFFSIYLRPDVRQEASNWLELSTPPGSTFLVEEGNMVDIPLAGNFQRLSVNFYDFEDNPAVRQKALLSLSQSDYFLIQSRRIFFNHQRSPKQFPKTAAFYNALFSGQLGFTEVKKFTSYPVLSLGRWRIEFPDEAAEETWSVFDHPVIRVFQKTNPLTPAEYAKILNI